MATPGRNGGLSSSASTPEIPTLPKRGTLTLIAMLEQIQAMESKFGPQMEKLQQRIDELQEEMQRRDESPRADPELPHIHERISQLEVVQLAGDRRLAEICSSYKEKFSAQIVKLQQQSDCLLGLPCFLERVGELEASQLDGDRKFGELRGHFKSLSDEVHAQSRNKDQADARSMDWLQVTARLEEIDLQHQALMESQEFGASSSQESQRKVVDRLKRLEVIVEDIRAEPRVEAAPQAVLDPAALVASDQRAAEVSEKVDALMERVLPLERQVLAKDEGARVQEGLSARLDAQEEALKRFRYRQLGNTIDRTAFEEKIREMQNCVRDAGQTEELQEQIRTLYRRMDRQDAEISKIAPKKAASQLSGVSDQRNLEEKKSIVQDGGHTKELQEQLRKHATRLSILEARVDEDSAKLMSSQEQLPAPSKRLISQGNDAFEPSRQVKDDSKLELGASAQSTSSRKKSARSRPLNAALLNTSMSVPVLGLASLRGDNSSEGRQSSQSPPRQRSSRVTGQDHSNRTARGPGLQDVREGGANALTVRISRLLAKSGTTPALPSGNAAPTSLGHARTFSESPSASYARGEEQLTPRGIVGRKVAAEVNRIERNDSSPRPALQDSSPQQSGAFPFFRLPSAAPLHGQGNEQ